MKLARRAFLRLAVGVAGLPVIPQVAWAQNYPTRPVRIVVGFAPGGSTDLLARLMGQWLSERLGQQFVIENRPGAAGNIATEAVARATPDGYTLLLIDTQPAINVTLYDKLNFDFIRDITPVAGITRVPAVMVVNPSVPAKTVPEFIAYARTNPGRLNFASPGNGTGPHLAAPRAPMLDRSLKAEFESYRQTLSTDEARRAFDERIERLLSQHGVDYVRGYVNALKDASS